MNNMDNYLYEQTRNYQDNLLKEMDRPKSKEEVKEIRESVIKGMLAFGEIDPFRAIELLKQNAGE